MRSRRGGSGVTMRRPRICAVSTLRARVLKRGGRDDTGFPALYCRDKMQSGRVVVTGMGGLTPVGLDVPTTWDNIIHGRSGIALVEGFERDDLDVRIAGQVK